MDSMDNEDNSEYPESTEGSLPAHRNPKDEVQAEVKRVKDLARKETRSIKFWRAIVLAMILATGAAVSTLVYVLLGR